MHGRLGHEHNKGTRIGFEWVDTNANPSDGLSRDGPNDKCYGSQAVQGESPKWHYLPSDTDRFRKMDSRF